MSYVEKGHLGGYKEGGDEATFYPVLWEALHSTYKVQTAIDVGAGDGAAVDYLNSVGIKTLGIEGIPQANEHIIEWDFTRGIPTFYFTEEVDLIWSCEFVEHVDEKYIPNFMEVFKRGKMVLMTHAMPGQDGYHHVNCQMPKYWIDKMKENGFNLDTKLTTDTRALSRYNKSPWNHYARSGLAFRRE